jgi:hypothetical protein
MIDEFIKLFSGLQENFGKADMSKAEFDKERNKIKPPYVWAQETVTPSHYKQHLAGTISIGIQPCTKDGKASFGCIDVDAKNYKDFNIPLLLSYIEKYKLPLIPCRSKSGGLHIYLFLKEAIDAQTMRDSLASLLLPLELPRTTEIYPKQVELEPDENGNLSGNFINLPYQKEKETTRHALDKNNRPLSLEQFIKIAIESQLNPSELKQLITRCEEEVLKGGDPEFEDGPCCLQRLSKTKLGDGRDRFMFNYMVFAKKKYKEDWPDKVNQANKYFAVPWPLKKINDKIRAWTKDTAGHTCNDEILEPKCMKHVCVKRKFGIKSDVTTIFPLISGLQKIMSTTPRLRFMVEKPDGKPVQCEASNPKMVTKQSDLLDLIWLQANFMPDPLSPGKFRAFLNQLAKDSVTIYPASGTDIKDQLYQHLYTYCVNSTQAKTKSDIRGGLCWTEGGFHYFIFSSFFETLPTRWKLDARDTGIIMKHDLGAEDDVSYNINNKTQKVWRLKQMKIDQIEYKKPERKEPNY